MDIALLKELIIMCQSCIDYCLDQSGVVSGMSKMKKGRQNKCGEKLRHT